MGNPLNNPFKIGDNASILHEEVFSECSKEMIDFFKSKKIYKIASTGAVYGRGYVTFVGQPQDVYGYDYGAFKKEKARIPLKMKDFV